MIKINLIKSKIINYNYINFITFMYYKADTFNNNKLISPIIILTISSNTIKINITFINFTTNLATKLNTNFSNIISYKVAIFHNNNNKPNFIIISFIININKKNKQNNNHKHH